MEGIKGGISYATSNSPDNNWDHWMDWDPISRSDLASTASVQPSTDGHGLQRSSIDTNQSRNLTPDSKEEDVSPRPAKKRKASAESADSVTRSGSQDGKPKSTQNKSHSIVEKRYRTNINDKIADLRKSIPSLRVPASAESLSAAPKHNKSTVLTKAIEYIHHLEQRNAHLENVNASLQNQALETSPETVKDRGTLTAESLKSPCAGLEDSPSTAPDSPTKSNVPHGMIPVPDEIRKLRDNAPQEHYADRICSIDRQPGAQVSIRGGKLIGKLMVGSLAGILVIDGFTGDRRGRDNDRGLFALPFSAPLPTLPSLWTLQGRSAAFPYAFFILPLIKGFLIFSILGLILFLYLFNSKPKLGLRHAKEGESGTRSSASPIEVRENAWLTAIQTLKVPRHSWFPEMMALILETGAYIIRQLLGWEFYSWLMGRSEEEEIARVRAWEIAIDAQLTGGDAEVSRSRLVLTVWAAGTLPKTPARLMLKALHIRIMFWQASRWPRICWAFNLAASRLAQYQWSLAKQMLDTGDVAKGSENIEPLSDHLLALLQRPAEDVMTDLTVQQAHNLCWNRSAATTLEDVGIDDNAEDTAMRGPLDILALWSSSLVLQEALSGFLETGEASQAHIPQIETALRTAPPGSSSSVRALAAKTVFSETNRKENLNKLTEALSSSSAVSFSGSDSGNGAFSSIVRNGVLTCIECATALDALAGPQSDTVSFDNAVRFLHQTCSRFQSLDLLALAAAYNLMFVLINDFANDGRHLSSLHQIIRNTAEEAESFNQTGPSAQERFKTALRRLQRQRRLSNASDESGYVSM